MAVMRDIGVPARFTTIKGSFGKALLYLAISLVFVAMGAFLAGDPRQATMAWLCIVLFGLGAAVFVRLLFRPHILTLDDEGFTVSGGLIRAAKKTPWRDVEGFFVYRLPKAGKMVGYNLAPGIRNETALAKIGRSLGADRALPRGWAMSAEKVAETLNAYRARALAK